MRCRAGAVTNAGTWYGPGSAEGMKNAAPRPGHGSDLLPILLDAGRAQSGEAMLVDGGRPGQEFVTSQGVAAAGFLEGEQAAADRGTALGLAADHPPFGPGRGQIGDC